MSDTQKRRELKEEDRYLIEKCFKEKHSKASMARLLGVSEKTVHREIMRGIVEERDSELRSRLVYRAYYAHERHKENTSRRGRKPTYNKHGELIKHIRVQMLNKWSPDAITGRRRLEGESTVCTKTVYNWLQRGYIKEFTMKHRQRKVSMRKVSYKNPTTKRIDIRPKEANERASGHWEMDLVVSGAGKAGSLLVLTERASRHELIYLLPDKKQPSVTAVLDRLERLYKGKFRKLFKTITCDNGSEFLNSDSLEKSILGNGRRTEVYYAHPYSSWERGSNENANKLIRKFIKKGEDISKLPVAYIKRIEKWMNNYPRRIFGYKTANEVRIA